MLVSFTRLGSTQHAPENQTACYKWLSSQTINTHILSVAGESSTNYLTACAGRPINTDETKCHGSNSVIRLKSLTVYASTDVTALDGVDNSCLGISECKRIIHSEFTNVFGACLHRSESRGWEQRVRAEGGIRKVEAKGCIISNDNNSEI